MKKLNLTEEQINKTILDTVKKHISEQTTGGEEDHGVNLLNKYIGVTAKYLVGAKQILEHQDADFMLQENEHVFESVQSIMQASKDVYEFLKAELGVPEKKKEPVIYNKKNFKDYKSNKKDISLNEND